jgi:hypothetical protein
MHTHAVRTTEDRLAETIDLWVGPAPAHSTVMPVVVHKGSRDYLVIVRHPEHDESAHDRHGAHGETDAPIVVGTYDDNESYGGWVEDRARSWILYYGHGGRPEVMWLRRDTTGGVVGEPISFSGAEAMSLDESLALRDAAYATGVVDERLGRAAIPDDRVMYAVTSGVGRHAPHHSVLIDRITAEGRERVAELAPIGAAGDPIETLVDYTREVLAVVTLRPAEPLAEEKAAAIESYTARLSRERSHFYNETVSARETLRTLGWPDAADSSVALHRGITWLAEQKNPPRVPQSKQIRTREVLAVIGSEGVTVEHAVYVEIDGRNHPAADVTTCNGGHGLLIVAPPLRDTYRDYEVRLVDDVVHGHGELVLTRRVDSVGGGGRTEELMRLPAPKDSTFTAEQLLNAVMQAVTIASPK